MKRLLLAGCLLCFSLSSAWAASRGCTTIAKSERDVCVQETAKNLVQKGRCNDRYFAALDRCEATPADPVRPLPPPGYADPLNPALPRSTPVQPQVNPVHPRTEPVRPGIIR